MSMSIRVEYEVVREKHIAVDIESNRILQEAYFLP